MAVARVSRLTEANSLLFALQRVAQTMPASLDLDEVVDSTFGRIEAIMPADSMSLYLLDEPDGEQLLLYRDPGRSGAIERSPRRRAAVAQRPRSRRRAPSAPRGLADGVGLAAGARSGVYTALRARGAVTGALVVESTERDGFTQQHVEIVHGLTEAFGIAVDNARLFRQIRTVTADEERTRIARDLHDQVGSIARLPRLRGRPRPSRRRTRRGGRSRCSPSSACT